MNPIAVALAGYILLGAEVALRSPLMLGETRIAPYFVLVLVAYLAMYGPQLAVLWASLLLGLAVDLVSIRPVEGGTAIVNILGPNALGYMAGAYCVLLLRGTMIRRNPLTIVFLSVIAALGAQIVATVLYTVRHWFDSSLVWDSFHELTTRLASGLYTAVAAAFVGWLLNRLSPLMGFADAHPRYGVRR